MPPAELGELRPGLVLLDDPDDLLVGEPARAHLPSSQGCSVLGLSNAAGEETVEAEGVGVDGLANVADAIGPQDIEGEGAQPGEHPRPGPDAAVVLAQDPVTDVVGAV